MENLSWRIVKHSELKEQDRINISLLKEQHWPHGLASQLAWLQANVDEEDFHLLGENYSKHGKKLSAYLSLNNVSVEIDGRKTECIGLGSVCVDKTIEHSGLGRKLVMQANHYIESQKQKGILLCKQKLVRFYEKCEWNALTPKRIYVAGCQYEHEVMMYNNAILLEPEMILIQKNF